MNEVITISGVDCYEKDGTAYLKLEAVARGLGFTQTQEKNGTETAKGKKAVKSTDAKNCVGYEERTSGGGGHAVAFGMRHGFPYLPFSKAGGNACSVPYLPCQRVGDGGHPTGPLEAERETQALQCCKAARLRLQGPASGR